MQSGMLRQFGLSAFCAFVLFVPLVAMCAGNSQILITVVHDSQQESRFLNGANRNYLGATRYESTLAARATIEQLSKRYDLSRPSDEWQIDSLGVFCAVFDVEQHRDLPALVGLLQEDSDVEAVQLMETYVTQGASGNDTNKLAVAEPDRGPKKASD